MDTFELAALADLAYAAAIDDALWPAWCERMTTGFGMDGGVFQIIDAAGGKMSRSHFNFLSNVPNDEIVVEYAREFVHLDPQVSRALSLRRSEIFLDTEHVNRENKKTRDYLLWEESRCGVAHHMTAATVLNDGLRREFRCI